MKRFMKDEKGMELIQGLGLAAIAIVLVSVTYVALNGSFGTKDAPGTWLGAINKGMNDVLAKFSVA